MPHSHRPSALRSVQAGFTLVELVIVIAITGIVAAVGGILITGTVDGYLDQTRRAELVDTADRALRRMSREIRPALPNSLRTCAGDSCIEFLPTVAGARYRVGPGPAPVGGDPARRLRFNQADDSFNSTGPLGLADGSYSGLRVSVYNTGQAGNDAWQSGQSMSAPGVTLAADPNVAGETRVTLNNAHQFPLASPRQRFHLVDAPVAFACQGRELRRFSDYAPGDDFTNGDSAVLASNVEDCRFDYIPGTSTRAGLLSLKLVLEDEGEQVRLLHQVHVDNAP
ncbi:MSHA biogenesis protein MshO [Natronospira proteinivora]|uniref:MSHA biogenesis protein MshO n=1 Tax=Natronospira proteinivora TaxID=1807133 RepID=A0ABT1G9V2_9GAMM|nr:type II secretion system protein [Natronospira proteinivora]MCP1728085.1 MSHA biogenesis protein MshO [Natronospira proteinivora]